MATTNYYTIGGKIKAENQVGGSGYRSYGPDALGSVIETYDAAGLQQDSFRYSPYGRTILSTGSASAPAFAWVGSLGYRNNARVFFEYYVRARHYSSHLLRWTRLDTLWPEQKGYIYAESNPCNRVDPSGNITHTTCTSLGKVGFSNKEINNPNYMGKSWYLGFDITLTVPFTLGPRPAVFALSGIGWWEYYSATGASAPPSEPPDTWYLTPATAAVPGDNYVSWNAYQLEAIIRNTGGSWQSIDNENVIMPKTGANVEKCLCQYIANYDGCTWKQLPPVKQTVHTLVVDGVKQDHSINGGNCMLAGGIDMVTFCNTRTPQTPPN
ncbi:MAG TPA: RHS repeat-associated core domain-containing protein [Fimbriimonadaceae bacterium]|jgi:RHS repeat-associated protein